MLERDPNKRIDARKALEHPWVLKTYAYEEEWVGILLVSSTKSRFNNNIVIIEIEFVNIGILKV